MSLHLDSKQLDALLAVVEHGRYTKAAAALRGPIVTIAARCVTNMEGVFAASIDSRMSAPAEGKQKKVIWN